MKKYILFLGWFVLAVSCRSTKTYNIQAKSSTNTRGQISFVQKKNEVKMVVKASKLTPGIHAIHIHEKGDCSAADASSAGGHWNPMKEMHGKWGHGQHHNGDIGNLIADQDGKATLTFRTERWCIGCKDETKNILNKSIIIHKSEDDFKTQPTGNAGGRIGCVEIK